MTQKISTRSYANLHQTATQRKRAKCVSNQSKNKDLEISVLELTGEDSNLSFDFEPIVKSEKLKKESNIVTLKSNIVTLESNRFNPILPPGFKPVCLNKNGLISKIGLAQSVKLEPISNFKEEEFFISDSIVIKEESLS